MAHLAPLEQKVLVPVFHQASVQTERSETDRKMHRLYKAVLAVAWVVLAVFRLWGPVAILTGATVAVALFLRAQKRAQIQQAKEEAARVHMLRQDVAKIEAKIGTFDSFVKRHPDLFQLFSQLALQHPEHIAKPPELPEGWDQHGEALKLELAKNTLEHTFNERKRFVMGNAKLLACFIAHFKTENNQLCLEA